MEDPKLNTDGENETDLNNILKISLITDVLCRFLSFSDLKCFRGANSFCNEVCLPVILKRVKPFSLREYELDRKCIKIESPNLSAKEAHLKAFRCDQKAVFERATKTLINLINNSRKFPCSEFCLQTRAFATLSDSTLLGSFIAAISSFVTKLEFQKQFEHSKVVYRNPEVTVQFPILKALRIHFCNYIVSTRAAIYDSKHWTKDIEFYAKVFQASPKLDTFHLFTNGSISDQEQGNFVTSLFASICTQTWGNISHLCLNSRLKTCHFAQLSQLGLKLTTLSLTVSPLSSPLVDTSVLMKFLETQSESLKTMRFQVDVKFGDEIYSASFPCIKNLKTLKFRSKLRFPDFSFSESFPCLKHLSIFDNFDNLEDFFNSRIQPLLSVTTLELPNTHLNSNVFVQVARIFPNITSLKIFGKLELLKIVYTQMNNVKELTLLGEDKNALHQILTGYNKDELHQAFLYFQDIKKIVTEERNPLPYLNNVPMLHFEDIWVTDIMCKYGLRKMNPPKELNIWTPSPAWVTQIKKVLPEELRTKLNVRIRKKAKEISNEFFQY